MPVLLASLAGCITEPVRPDVIVRYRLDTSCQTPLSVVMLIDGDSVDTETITPGKASKGSLTTKAVHTLAAYPQPRRGFRWGPDVTDLTRYDVFTYTLPCP